MELTEEQIRKSCVEGGFFRGKRFLKGHPPTQFNELEPGLIQGFFSETDSQTGAQQEFHSSLDFREGNFSHQCPCPEDDNVFCKHGVALGLHFLGIKSAPPSRERNDRHGSTVTTLNRNRFDRGGNNDSNSRGLFKREEKETRPRPDRDKGREPRDRLERDRSEREREPITPQFQDKGDRTRKGRDNTERHPWKSVMGGFLSEAGGRVGELKEELVIRVFTHQKGGLASLSVTIKMLSPGQGEESREKPFRFPPGRYPRWITNHEKDLLDFTYQNQSHDRRKRKKDNFPWEDKTIQSHAIDGFLNLLQKIPNVYAGFSDQKVRIHQNPIRLKLKIAKGKRGGMINLHAFADKEGLNLETAIFLESGKPWATDGSTFQEINPGLPVYQILPLLSGEIQVEADQKSDFYENYLLPLEKATGDTILVEDGVSLHPLENLPIQPVIILVERKKTLYIHLSLKYAECPELVTLGDRRDFLELLSQESGTETVFFKRDREREEKFLNRLVRFGLVKSGEFTYTLEGDFGFDFLFDAVPVLKKEGWDIKGLEHLKEYSLTAGYPEFHVSVKCAGGLIDLSWKMIYEGKEINLVDYWRAFEVGNYTFEPGPGVSVRVNEHWFKRMRDTLHDLWAIAKETAPLGHAKLNHYQASIVEDFVNAATHEDIDEGWKNFSERFNKFQGIEHSLVPETLKGELREYQQEGYDWLSFLREFGFSGVLADDMGLGKTLQALTLLESFRLKGSNDGSPSLVVAPTSVASNWIKEAAKFYPDMKVLLYSGKDRKKQFEQFKKVDVVVTNYTLARLDFKTLMDIPFFYLILDEAHYIKNHQSQTAIAVASLRAQFRLALTGTPLENHLGELWSQFNFLMPGFLGDPEWFDLRYRKPIENQQNRNLLRKLNKRISPFIMRRLKSEVARDLPEKTITTLFCEMDTGQKKLYTKLVEGFKSKVLNEFDSSGGKSNLMILDALLKLRQVAIHPPLLNTEKLDNLNLEIPEDSAKMEMLKDMIHEMVSGGNHRALIFSQFTKMLGCIRDYLDEQKIKYCYLDGASRDRDENVEAFQNDETIPIFLISLKAGGVGLNLTGADYVIHMDPWWNPAVEEQANDRAYRIGQSRQVFVYKLVTADTIEERILKLQETKKALFDGVVSGVRFEKSLTKEDLIDLFN